MKNISIFGTSSDAGKSTLTFVIAKLLQDRGVSVAPFKAQNVSNNAQVCDDGSEISVAQYFQAQVLNIETSYHLNPVLLKSGQGNGAHLIVEGKSVTTQDVRAYYKNLDQLKPAVKRCFDYLDKQYDCVVCEGAGSPVELNLMDKDLSNVYIADEFNTKIILVADIEKGGVFASIYGVVHLLPEKLRKNIIGVVINKFRGDRTLFDKGVRIIEEEFKIPVLGVLPYMAFNLGLEDNESLKNIVQDCSQAKQKIGVIHYPTMSNYNDFEPLIADDAVCLEFVRSNINLDHYDKIILPGSKLVIKDLIWLKESGLFDQLKSLKDKGKTIIGICGGYQMMFKSIVDEYCVETSIPTRIDALGFVDDVIYFKKEKILKRKGHYFEMHHGVSQKYPLSFKKKNISGTFYHGLFDDGPFQSYKHKTIKAFIDTMRAELDINLILKAIA